MKSIFFILFTSVCSALFSQQTIKCILTQHFEWNQATQTNEVILKNNEKTYFEIDFQNKTISITYADNSDVLINYNSKNSNSNNTVFLYNFKSPTDGMDYIYKINSNLHTIELVIINNLNEIVLKRYQIN